MDMESNPSEDSCLSLANHLISQCLSSSPQISNIDQINSNLITSLSESITGISVPDLLVCEDKIAEAHNIQAVIDMLSLDLLGISLSHITGEDVVSGNLNVIFNLLQVLDEVRNYLSVDTNGKKILKRKINRFEERKQGRKKSPSLNSNEKSSVNSVKEMADNIEDIQEDHISVPKSNLSASSHSNGGQTRPAFSRSRLKIKRNYRINKNILNDSSMKESSFSSTMSKYQPSESKEHLFSSKNEAQIDAPSKDATFCISKYSDEITDSKDTPHLSTPIHLLENTENLQQHRKSPTKRVINRKISKLPRSKSKSQDQDIEQEIEQLYDTNLDTKLKLLIQKNSCIKARSSQLKRNYLQTMKKPFKKTQFSPCHKSYLLPHNLRRRSSMRNTNKPTHSKKPDFLKNTPKKRNSLISKSADISPKASPSFIQTLLDEFPGIELSPSVLNHIKEKYEQHLLKMHKQIKTCLFQKPKTQLQAERAAQKQQKVSNILKKDIKEQEFLNKVKEQKNIENKIKFRLRDSRLKSVQMKQYYDEFQIEMRQKMQKRNKTEEMIFERVFKEVINIQKDHVDYLCQQAKEIGEEDAKKHLNYLESLENLYQSQFMLLSEKLTEEKTDAKIRLKAEQQDFENMQRDFQETLKHEIRFMQKATVELMEDCHFRELDAEQFIECVRDQCT